MQFHKLFNFLNLINIQRQCQCHQRYYRYHYRYNQHYKHHKNHHHHACKWNLFMFITVLIALTTVSLATNPTNPIEPLLQSPFDSQHQAKNLDNVVALASPKTVNDKRNTTDDFERILLEQLKREQELKENVDETNSDTNYNAAMVTQRKMLLSRKRRYLLFPEGSSFQVVYDGIIGIVDYTNYLILGITLALAWELPTKAPSEMLEDIKMQVEDGTLLLPRNDTVKNITYVDIKKKVQKSQQRQFTKPNYINFAYQKSNYNRNPYYDYQKFPVFMPPMHRNYYQQSRSHMKPGTSTKYGYYFQPKVEISSDGMTSYSPYIYGTERLSDWRRKDNYYYKQNVSHKPMHPFTKWLPMKSYTPTYSETENSKYPWWNLTSRLTNSLREGYTQNKRPVITATARQFNNINDDYKGILQQKQQQQKQQLYMSGYYQSNAPTTTTTAPTLRKHRIYPVFGKRSLPEINPDSMQQKSPAAEQPHLNEQQQRQHHNHQNEHHQHQQRQRRRCGIDNDELSKFDRIHIRHHRHTRHTLYEKIEKYLDKRGSHGHHCVLRALCETGQKTNEHKPGSFLGELMRALFTIPEPVEEDLNRLKYKETRYDAAHAHVGSCEKRYFHCKDSLWKSHFIA